MLPSVFLYSILPESFSSVNGFAESINEVVELFSPTSMQYLYLLWTPHKSLMKLCYPLLFYIVYCSILFESTSLVNNWLEGTYFINSLEIQVLFLFYLFWRRCKKLLEPICLLSNLYQFSRCRISLCQIFWLQNDKLWWWLHKKDYTDLIQ